MSLHIVPVGEIHQHNPGCPCRPRQVAYARRTAWKHQEAAEVTATHVTEVVRAYGLSPNAVDRMVRTQARRMGKLVDCLPGARR